MKKHILGALVALLLLAPLAASAESSVSVSSYKNYDDTIAQLQKQVTELLAKIERLKAEKGSAVAFCHTFSTDLGIGSSGADVTALRTALRSAGIDAGAEGTFDEDFAAFVVKFQGKHGIRQTGFVGPLTRAKLNKLYDCNLANREVAAKALKEAK